MTDSPAGLTQVDLLIVNTVIVTMDAERRIISDGAIAVDDGLIIAIGKSAELRRAYRAHETIDTEAPGSNGDATTSRFNASGQDRRRRPGPIVSITSFVDTSHLHHAAHRDIIGRTARPGKAASAGGIL